MLFKVNLKVRLLFLFLIDMNTILGTLSHVTCIFVAVLKKIFTFMNIYEVVSHV